MDINGEAPDVELSIIIPLFNRADLIGACIERLPISPGVELIIVDDGSIDGSADAAKEAISKHPAKDRIRLLEQENAGPGAARNKGAVSAAGNWLAFLDSDDLWAPQTIADVLSAAGCHQDAIMMFLQTKDFLTAQGMPESDQRESNIVRHSRFLVAVDQNAEMRFASCNVAVRKDVFLKLGGFTGDVLCSEDSDLFLRADRQGLVLCLTGPWRVAHRVGENDSLSLNAPKVIQGYEFMLAQDTVGEYGEADDLKEAFFSKAAVYTIRVAFACGHTATAYKLFFRDFGRISQATTRHWVWRLLLTPALSLIRPKSFPMRWK